MKRTIRVMTAVLTLCVLMVGVAVAKQPTGYYNTAGIELQNGVTWDADFSTKTAWEGEIHYVAGYTLPYQGDVEYGWAGGFGVGVEQSWTYGYVVYKFRCPNGYQTDTGGTVYGKFTSDVYDPCTAEYLNFGIHDTFDPAAGYGNWTRVHPTANSCDLSLDVPVGVSEFYIVVYEHGSNDAFGVNYDSGNPSTTGLHASVPMVELFDPLGTAVILDSDPNQMLKMFAWDLQEHLNNEVGLSGVILDSMNLGDPAGSPAEFLADAAYLTNQAQRVGALTFALKISLDATPEFSATTWQDNGDDWTNAMDHIDRVGQWLAQTGASVVIIDVSNPGVTGHMIEKTSSAEQAAAYNRGAAIATTLRSYISTVKIILTPELGAEAYWGGANSVYTPATSVYHQFRNGLMSVTPNIRVYVGTEGTLGNSGAINDAAISLRENGSPVDYTDAATYQTALESYLTTVAAQMRATSTSTATWDNYGGLAPAFSVLGTEFSTLGRQSAYYTPELFAAQLEGFDAAGAELIWEKSDITAWNQWMSNQVTDAGLEAYDPCNITVPDYPANWLAVQPVHPYIEAYRQVLRERGTPADPIVYDVLGDINGDADVNLGDLGVMSEEW